MTLSYIHTAAICHRIRDVLLSCLSQWSHRHRLGLYVPRFNKRSVLYQLHLWRLDKYRSELTDVRRSSYVTV